MDIFSIQPHVFSFVHCPSVPLPSGWGFREQRPAFRLPHWGLWLGLVSLSLWRPPGPLLSFPPSQTKWVKSTRLQGGGGGESCWRELRDRPVVVSGQRDVCQTVAGCEQANERLTECVCAEQSGCSGGIDAAIIRYTASSAVIVRHKYLLIFCSAYHWV